MQRNIHNYFTTGELSQLCKIPRKTLLYYDKLGLITPEVTDENGYRYYKRSQLFLLQLILTLRQLDVPIAQIKEYLANRSLTTYNQLFNERIQYFTRQIEHLQEMKNELLETIADLGSIANIKSNEITLTQAPAQYLFISQHTEENECFKKRSTHIANMFALLQKEVAVTTNSFGYIYDAQILKDLNVQHIQHYFYTLAKPVTSPHCYERPAGIYATLHFQGVYMFNYKKNLQLLADFCKEQKLSPLSPLYVTSLADYWTTGDMDKYIYKVEVKVK